MSDYYHSHILRLKQELRERFDRLLEVLTPHAAIHVNDKEVVNVSASKVRVATDDFKTILTEVRRLK